MISDIMNINKLVKVNSLPEVTSPLTFNSIGIPDENGLFSYTIFGLPGSADRKQKKAYINLNGKYLHPLVYKILSLSYKLILNIISGTEYAIWDEKAKTFVKCAPDTPKANTGIDFVYKHWLDIKWRTTESQRNEDMVYLLKTIKIDEAFIDKWIVGSAFYRDMSFTEGKKSAMNDINKLYQKLIRYSQTIKSDSALSFTYQTTRNYIQNTLVEIYTHYKDLIRLKHGHFHQAVMGKNIDYGLRTVITAPTYTANSWKDMPANYKESSVPLVQVISGMVEHVVAWITDWIIAVTGNKPRILVYDFEKKKTFSKDLANNWKDDFTRENLIKRINLFVSSPETRYDAVKVRFADNTSGPIMYVNDHNDLKLTYNPLTQHDIQTIRYFTWTDLFYIAGYDVSAGCSNMCTRYPANSAHNQYFSKIKLRGTWETCEMVIDDKLYRHYPKIDLMLSGDQIESAFVDSYEIFTPYIKPMNADHDGDQVTSRMLYSKEANDWVDDYLNSPLNYLKFNGKSDRIAGDVAQHTIFNIMRKPDI